MNLGLRDVACLRRVLREARDRCSDIGATHVLRRYERERRSENTMAARGLDTIERVYGYALEPVAAMRGAFLAVASAVPPLRHLLIDAAAGRRLVGQRQQ
jgi:2-octaprenyl-3-methyl-6-methoxy-1,4-benzoquinol hydroxylase/2-octaprenylphenol hydroxylase